MRLARFASLVALVLLAAGLRGATAGQAERPDAPKARVSVSADAKYPTWTITHWGKTVQDGTDLALEAARGEVADYLAQQDPSVHWRPGREYINQHLVVSRQQKFRDLGDKDELLGPGYDVTLTVKVGPREYRDMLEQDRQVRVRERELLLARVLAGVVALLVAVVGYLRLDEATKGYYTLWLRLGALGLLGAVAALLVLG